ncbi:LytTR DNA-binding domain [Moorella glycerini]|uniref:LytTr DNA-binding domain protein n=1 Tax=Neomoorella stamsii TaxID=1266720 RepID=A0A9X7P5D6_9FIRM|nr:MULTISPECIES: LytTR family DNA-binding domain-containing protein [Moorella]PRR71305.1 LytTr DNA-binding domain protein [Moorella stamsii]CEP66654.1 LytTR DNA-binding domain [Moorella glycerini]
MEKKSCASFILQIYNQKNEANSREILVQEMRGGRIYRFKDFQEVALFFRAFMSFTARTGNEDVFKAAPLYYLKGKSGQEVTFVNIGDIFFIETWLGRYSCFHTTRGRRYCYKSLKEVEEDLKKYFCFVRTHQSYIVNLKRIKRLIHCGGGGYKVIFDDYEIPAWVSRSKVKTLTKMLEEAF